jgi:hypothetical protein
LIALGTVGCLEAAPPGARLVLPGQAGSADAHAQPQEKPSVMKPIADGGPLSAVPG